MPYSLSPSRPPACSQGRPATWCGQPRSQPVPEECTTSRRLRLYVQLGQRSLATVFGDFASKCAAFPQCSQLKRMQAINVKRWSPLASGASHQTPSHKHPTSHLHPPIWPHVLFACLHSTHPPARTLQHLPTCAHSAAPTHPPVQTRQHPPTHLCRLDSTHLPTRAHSTAPTYPPERSVQRPAPTHLCVLRALQDVSSF